MFEGASAAIDKALEETGQKSLNLVSYCVGGTLAGTLIAWMGKTGDKRVASRDLLHRAARLRGRGRAADLRRRAHPRGGRRGDGEGLHARRPHGERLQHAAVERPDLGLRRHNYMLGKDPFPFDLLYWNAEFDGDAGAGAQLLPGASSTSGTPSPRASSRSRGEPITLADISGPVYHVATKEDHIAPAASVYRGAKEMTQGGRALRAVGLGAHRRGGEPAGAAEVPVLDQPRHVEADARGLAQGRRGDAGELVAGLGRLAAGSARGGWWRRGSPGRGSGRSSRRRGPTSRCASTSRKRRSDAGAGSRGARRVAGASGVAGFLERGELADGQVPGLLDGDPGLGGQLCRAPRRSAPAASPGWPAASGGEGSSTRRRVRDPSGPSAPA